MSGAPTAVVELGSGSVKLLIIDGDTEIGRAVKTRLGSALGPNGEIGAAGLDATARVLADFAALIDEHGAAPPAVVATAAARNAPNVDDLVAVVRSTLGADMAILSGRREAELSFAGAASGQDPSAPLGLIDVGARSTEFAVRSADGSVSVHSLPVGARSITEDFLHGDPPAPAELSSALSVVELHLDDLRRELPDLGPALEHGRLLGNGAVIQMAAVEVGTGAPDLSLHDHRLEKVGVEEVFRTLATETAEDRAFNPGLLPEHVDDIVGALCVLVEFMRQYAVDELTVVERGVRHGVAGELLAGR